MSEAIVTVFSRRDLRSFPKFPVGGIAEHMPLAEALARRWRTDAHVAPYFCDVPRRLGRRYLDEGLGTVELRALFFDLDCEETHGTPTPAPDRWYASQRPKLRAMLAAHPDAVIYASRGGLRIVYAIEPVTLANATDAANWLRLYRGFLSYLKRRFGLIADAACGSWTWSYRLPFVRRDGVDEDRGVLNDPDAIGTWSCKLLASDLPPGKKIAATRTAPTDSGVLPKLFAARGWLGTHMQIGEWHVRCPWLEEHTDGRGDGTDNSTILYGAAAGQHYGWLRCLHSHCADRRLSDVLDVFTADELRAAGAVDAAVSRSIREGAK